MFELRWQRRFRLSDDSFEGRAFVHRQISHNLTVKLNPGKLHAVHELRIGQTLFAYSSVNALNPKTAESPLLRFAIAVSVLAGLFDRLARNANGVFAAAAIALGLFE